MTTCSSQSLFPWSEIDLCSALDNPGAALDEPGRMDWSKQPTSPDQLQIEAALAGPDLTGMRLLHVGIGDSGLALRFHRRCRWIDGVTMSRREESRARSLELPNYGVFRVNKYSRELVRSLQPGYDFIIDNNLASFTCCLYHLAVLFDTYHWALHPGGRIVTEQRGMDWVARDPRWRMTYDDLAMIGQRFSLRAARIGDTVYALERC